MAVQTPRRPSSSPCKMTLGQNRSCNASMRCKTNWARLAFSLGGLTSPFHPFPLRAASPQDDRQNITTASQTSTQDVLCRGTPEASEDGLIAWKKHGPCRFHDPAGSMVPARYVRRNLCLQGQFEQLQQNLRLGCRLAMKTLHSACSLRQRMVRLWSGCTMAP